MARNRPPAWASLLAVVLCTAPAALAQNLDIVPGECSTLTFDFNSDDPSYDALISIPNNSSEGCVLRISRLYIQGSCTALRNNEGTGCGSSGGTVANASAASCAAVFAEAPPGAIVTPPIPATQYIFDSGAICNAYSDVAYFYVNYSCAAPAGGQPQLPLPLSYDAELRYNRYAGCGGSATPWTRYLVGAVIAAVALLILGLLFLQCYRRRGAAQQQPQPQPGAVQLAPAGGGAAGGYYTGSAAYEAGGQPPAYAGAWGGSAAGYPPPGGYAPASAAGAYGAYGGGDAVGYPPGGAPGYGAPPPPPPPHVPPPMTTVTLGQAAADDDQGGRLLAAADPAPPPGGGNPFVGGGAAAGGAPGGRDSQAKV